MSGLPNVRTDLFKDVKFFLADEDNEKVKQLLKQGGASREFFVSNLATHIVSSTTDFPEYNQAKDIGIPVVKPEWVTMSVKCDATLPPSAFSPEKDKLFSGVVACPSQIPTEDRDALWAMITFYGGCCQATFDPSCTHLLVPKPEGDKYECALQHPEVKIVIPDWVVDSIKAKTLLDESNYAPVKEIEAGAASESILTPDNDGQTTGATVNTKTKLATPSTLLSPESPSILKLKKALEDTNENPESEKSLDVSEEDETSEDEQEDKELNVKSRTRKGRQAAQTAKERLRSVAKFCADSERTDDKDSDYNMNEDMEEEQDTKGDNQDKTKHVIEIADEDKEATKEQVKDSLEKKVIVVSKLLSGCIFYISDYPQCIESDLLDNWITVIKQHDGDIAPIYSSKCTHVLCMHQHGKYFRMALNEGKYMVTAYWLNDVLSNKRLFAPKIPLHLPVPFREKVSRCRNMIISVTGFEGEERKALKNMIYMIGAKYTGYLSRSNTHLICHSETGEKYKKAKEWAINCTNARWLGDIMIGGCDYPVNMKRYRNFDDDNQLDINVILARELLEAWKNFEEKEETTDKKRKLEMLESEMKEFEVKKPRIEDPLPVPARAWTGVPRVVFTGLNPTAVRRLTDQLKALGGKTADSVKSCTHIVASKIMRTIKFLTGISVCRYIVSPEWIEESHAKNCYLDENDYILRDFENEKLYGMSLPESIKKAQARPLFKDITIYVTPNVRPDQTSMAEIVGCGGGKLLEQMPTSSSFNSLSQQKTDKGQPSFVCVTCDEDLHLCKEMKSQGIGIHNVEFVLSGILKQELDFHRYKL